MSALHVAARELRSLFCSPVAWTILAVVQGILGWVFVVQVWGFEQLLPRLPGMPGAPGLTIIVVAPVLKTAAVVLLLVAPLVTMRLVAEERRAGTLPLLLSAPLGTGELVVGKFLGVMAFFLAMLALVALMPLSLLAGGGLDTGLVVSGMLGLLLLMASFAAAGLFMSTLTAHPAVAAVATFGLLLLLWVIDWAGPGAEGGSRTLAYLSVTGHLDPLLRGVLDTGDVAYYLLFTATFLVLSARRMESLRLKH